MSASKAFHEGTDESLLVLSLACSTNTQVSGSPCVKKEGVYVLDGWMSLQSWLEKRERTLASYERESDMVPLVFARQQEGASVSPEASHVQVDDQRMSQLTRWTLQKGAAVKERKPLLLEDPSHQHSRPAEKSRNTR